VIIDLERFVAGARPNWSELDELLQRLESDPNLVMPLDQVRRFHYLYERTSADLARLMTFSAEPETRRYLEGLVARAYADIHESRERQHRFRPWAWLFGTLPRTFRQHLAAFWLTVAVTLAGILFGALATIADPESRSATMPFGHDRMSPAERVAEEERSRSDHLAGRHSSFSGYLMTHNTKVAIFTLALGMTWGVGTMVMLFQNGVALGAIGVDYVMAGQTKFLLGWLMPHGVIEIPAILIAAQAGFVLAGALIGRRQRASLAGRLRAVSKDVVTLIFGAALLLVWAGLVEAFLSQYHEPVVPYLAKIAFGVAELILLVCFLARAGRKESEAESPDSGHQPAPTTRAA
jgi:uncharacterized membrane protein SpoIIM required for sporulation